MESNDSREIPDRGVGGDIRRPPFGGREVQQYLGRSRGVIRPAVRTGRFLAVHADVEGGAGGQGAARRGGQLVP